MKFDFPINPANGDTYAPAGGPVWRWTGEVWLQSAPIGDPSIALIGDVAPATPRHGQLWWESDTGKLFVWYDDGTSAQWVETTAGSVNAGGFITPQMFGAVGNGVTDDTSALSQWLSALTPGKAGYVPAGTYLFTSPLVIANGEFSITGAGRYQSVFLYAGASTTVDMITVGSDSVDNHRIQLTNFKVESNTTMIGGNGLRLKRIAKSRVDDVVLGGLTSNFTLWDGIYFDRVGMVVYDGVDIKVRNDGLKVRGGIAGGGVLDGPKADLWVCNGKIGDCGRDGIVCGGAFGGFGLDNLDVASNGRYGIRIDKSLANEGNREILFNPGLWVDSNVTAGIVLDGGFGANGYMSMTGVWCAGGLTACMHITTNETAGGVRIQIAGGNFFLGGTSNGVTAAGPGDGIKIENTQPTVMIDGAVIRNCAGWGINNASGGGNVRVGINHYISNALGAVTANTNFISSASNHYGIGIAADAFGLLTLGGIAREGTTAWGLKERRVVGTQVTSGYDAMITAVATEAAAFTIAQINHFRAAQGAIGAGSTVTTQRGFYAEASLVGAGTNYGFYSGVPVGATNYGFYSASTTQNQFGGPTKVCAGFSVPAAGVAGQGLMFGNVTNFGVFYGSGAPTLSAAKGSLYLRSDGTGTADRMYVNTNGSTTWAAVTTAA